MSFVPFLLANYARLTLYYRVTAKELYIFKTKQKSNVAYLQLHTDTS
jgi:hypothetical protein